VLLTHLGSLAKLICRNQRRNEKQMNITNKKTDKWERKMKARKYIHIKLQPTKYDDKPVAEYRTIICILYSQLIKCMPLKPLYCILLRAICACTAVFKQLQYPAEMKLKKYGPATKANIFVPAR
jgi:hypothetical protein